MQQFAYAASDVIERVGFERKLHPAFAAELVHQYPRARIAFDVLKQQRRSSGLRRASSQLGSSIRNLSHLQNWIDLGSDALQLASLFELLNPVAKIVVGQFPLLFLSWRATVESLW